MFLLIVYFSLIVNCMESSEIDLRVGDLDLAYADTRCYSFGDWVILFAETIASSSPCDEYRVMSVSSGEVVKQGKLFGYPLDFDIITTDQQQYVFQQLNHKLYFSLAMDKNRCLFDPYSTSALTSLNQIGLAFVPTREPSVFKAAVSPDTTTCGVALQYLVNQVPYHLFCIYNPIDDRCCATYDLTDIVARHNLAAVGCRANQYYCLYTSTSQSNRGSHHILWVVPQESDTQVQSGVIRCDEPISTIVMSHDNSLVAAISGYSLIIIDMTKKEMIQRIDTGGPSQGVYISPAGRLCMSYDHTGLYVWNIETGSLLVAHPFERDDKGLIIQYLLALGDTYFDTIIGLYANKPEWLIRYTLSKGD